MQPAIPENVTLAIDIETVALPLDLAALPEPVVAYGNTKDPAKRAEKLAEAQRRRHDLAALDPHCSRVLALGLAWPDGDRLLTDCLLPASLAPADLSSTEPDLLARAWYALSRAAHVVTFNGAAFDLPFLRRRAAIQRICPTNAVTIDTNKYRTAAANPAPPPGVIPHTDVYQLLTQSEVGNGTTNPLGLPRTLHAYAERLLGKLPPYELDKGALLSHWEAGDIDDITTLASWDAATTLQLYSHLQPYYP